MLFLTAFFFAASYSALIQAAPAEIVARETFSGDATTYDVGLGACGIVNSNSELVIAVGHDLFDNYPGAGPNPNRNPICGKTLTATNPANGASVDVKIVDRCVGCQVHDLDFSPAAFAALYDGATTGRFNVEWSWDDQ